MGLFDKTDAAKEMAAAEVVHSDAELGATMRALKTWTLISKAAPPVAMVGGFISLAIFASQEAWVPMLVVTAVFVLAMFTLYFVAFSKRNRLRLVIGKSLTLPVLSEVFDVIQYDPNGHISSSVIRSAGLVSDWDRVKGSDYIEGSYKGINFIFSDIHLQREETDTDSDGHKTTKYISVFKGQWMVCDFKKELSATLRLIERKGGTKFNRTHDLSTSSVETENAAFNKQYRILTADDHTAFYLLTPHFMERLVSIDEKANAQSFFCFMDGKVHVALSNGRDSFELKGLKLDSTDRVRQKFRDDLSYMTAVVDELLLNDHLFKEAY